VGGNKKATSIAMTPAEHRKFIQERARRSEGWRWLHVFGSLKLAVILLITISLACAVATFMESSLSFKVAKYYIYDAPWFILWIGLLMVNLTCAAVTRWPWQRRHVGFVVTHAGIILLLLGALVGQRWGFEGSITLKKATEPSNTLVIDEPVLLVESPESGVLYEASLPVAVRRPTPERPRLMNVPHSNTQVFIDDYAENLTVRAQVEADPTQTGAAGVELVLGSAAMGQSMTVPLALAPVEARNYDMFGRARLELLEVLPPAPKPTKTSRTLEYRETHMVFARMPDTPVTHNTLGRPSGHRFLLESAKGSFQLRMIRPDGSEEIRPLAAVLDKPFTDMDTGTIVHLTNYWPDLRMLDGRPVSASEQPNNPAVLITIAGRLEDAAASPPLLRMAPRKDGALAYQLMKGNNLTGQGVVRPGESFLTGWADWSVTLKTLHPHSRIRTVAERAAEPVPTQGGDESQTITGIRAALRDASGRTAEPLWIPSGTSRVLELDGSAIRVGFGLKTHRLDFLVSLEDFQVPRDEGSNEPADFISDVRFDAAEGAGPHRARVQMNHPASFPPAWWRSWTGLNYKFSQAGWDPDELDKTTLQVLHDPGWSLKWIGSLLICGGIFTMFYLVPRTGGVPAAKSARTPATEEISL
jgi:hypothetical protein